MKLQALAGGGVCKGEVVGVEGEARRHNGLALLIAVHCIAEHGVA
jgi:hypothetical protein